MSNKVSENLALIKEWLKGLGGEALAAALVGFESALESGDKGAILANWQAVKDNTVGLVHSEGFLDGGEGATAQDLARALEKIEEGLNEKSEAASSGAPE